MKRFVVSLPDEMYTDLEAAANDAEIPMAELVRHALYEYLHAPALTTPLLAGQKTAAPRGGKRAGAGRPKKN